jgi:hypothetical protein
VKVERVDYTNLESLTQALQGQDAVISTLAKIAVPQQRLLIDASVKAGVKRFIPSEFGCDLKNPKVRALPVFADKVAIEEYLNELAEKGVISYTLVYTGGFLDWGLKNGMFLNFEKRKADVFDGGNHPFSVSRLSTAGKAVRRILTHPRETADRAIWVKDLDVTQNQLVRLAQSLTPGEEWELRQVDSAKLEKECLEQVEQKKEGPATMFGFIQRATFSPDFGNQFQRVHNETLGIRGMTGVDLEELMASIFGTHKLE